MKVKVYNAIKEGGFVFYDSHDKSHFANTQTLNKIPNPPS
jgi:hypothetical protein